MSRYRHQRIALVPQRVYKIETEIESLYHNHFVIQRRDQKLALQRNIKDLRKELGKLLADGYEQLCAAAFTTGSGSGQPTGIITALAVPARTSPGWRASRFSTRSANSRPPTAH